MISDDNYAKSGLLAFSREKLVDNIYIAYNYDFLANDMAS